MTPAFWGKKKVFLTGHTGFKGSWLTLWLKSLGAEITGYSLEPPTQPNLFELANVSEGISHIIGDIRDLGALNKTISLAKPEIIIHMAAQSLVRHSYDDPVETYATNIMGTVNLLEAVRQHSKSVRCVLNITSDKCYENKEQDGGYSEGDAMGGYDPYSSSKGCAELVTSAYRRSYFNIERYGEHGVCLASARAGNVIGGGDWAKDRLITDIMNSYLGGRTVIIRNPDATRPWQHVLEPLNGYLMLCEHMWENGPEFAQGWNFGPAKEDDKPVSGIVENIKNLLGDDFQWELDKQSHPHEATFLHLDASKAAELLGWSQKLTLDQNMEWVVQWYQAYKNRDDVAALTDEQIARYQGMVS